ncbi:primosomal protein DnaI [Enterococcus timonensis]|uniref:primosomal protein DnaI n=1 Tax=Enterococcus timonensis TaxID=1852364 RepID=UPI0008D9E95E|nr:primosomal protein DnaI [Enterococcus timonensis]
MEDVGKEIRSLIEKRNVGAVYEKLVAEVLHDPEVAAFLQQHQGQLTEEEILNSYAKLYEFVQEKEKYRRGEKNQLAPGYKPELVLNHHFIDVSYVATVELLKEQERLAILKRVSMFEMPKNIKYASFDQFQLTPQRAKAIDSALKFVEDYATAPEVFHKGLYLSGSFGVGKSYLLGAIAHELAKHGFATQLVHFPSFALDMKRAIGRGTVAEEIEQAKKVPILMLDDLGADNLSSWIRDEVLGVILQYRMQEELPLFISSNISLNDLEKNYLTTNQKGEEDPLKAKRLMERLRFLTTEVAMIGDNRRNE